MPNGSNMWPNTIDLRSGHDLATWPKIELCSKSIVLWFLQVKIDAELEFTTQNNIKLHPEALPCYMRSGQVNQGQWPNTHIWPLEPARHADSGCCVTFAVFWSPYSCSRYDFSPETCTLLHAKMKCKFDLVTWLDLAWIEVKLSCKRCVRVF